MIINKNIIFFSINGNGLGHFNRCLSYAQYLKNKYKVYFFSLASSIDILQQFHIKGEYFVSPFWSNTSTFEWNSELSIRLGMYLNFIHPDIVIFDGTWPYSGFISACKSYKHPLKKVWSRRGLLVNSAKKCPVSPSFFDMILAPGELGTTYKESYSEGTLHVTVPPVCLLRVEDLLSREQARQKLGLAQEGQYALFSLGPGNLKDISGIGYSLIQEAQAHGFQILWAQSPISVKDILISPDVRPLVAYPLVQYMRAFDIFVGAAGYNTCCEIVQTQIPSLIVPNTLLADNQMARAQMVTQYAPAVVSACESPQKCQQAFKQVLAKKYSYSQNSMLIPMNGAELAVKAISKLIEK